MSLPLNEALLHWVPFAYFAGNDPEKLKLSAALPLIFNKCKMEYQSRPDMTGAELYDFVTRCAFAFSPKQKHNLCQLCTIRFCNADNPSACTALQFWNQCNAI